MGTSQQYHCRFALRTLSFNILAHVPAEPQSRRFSQAKEQCVSQPSLYHPEFWAGITSLLAPMAGPRIVLPSSNLPFSQSLPTNHVSFNPAASNYVLRCQPTFSYRFFPEAGNLSTKIWECCRTSITSSTAPQGGPSADEAERT